MKSRTGSCFVPETSGFTLVELLVVIAIIGVLVALLLAAAQSPVNQAGGRLASTSFVHRLAQEAQPNGGLRIYFKLKSASQLQ